MECSWYSLTVYHIVYLYTLAFQCSSGSAIAICRSLKSFPQESRIHKDVKLENLMLLANSGPPHLVLIDLGVAETLQPQGLSAKWGV